MAAADLEPKVFEWLNDMFKGVDRLDGPLYSIFVPAFGSTALFVGVHDVFDVHTRVLVDAPVLLDVPVTQELFEYVGYRSNDFVFGSFVVAHQPGDNKGVLAFRQSLLADALDRVELEVACKVVAATADNIDNDLKIRFGGRLFGD